jgi:hypothetical protein
VIRGKGTLNGDEHGILAMISFIGDSAEATMQYSTVEQHEEEADLFAHSRARQEVGLT